MYAFIPEEAAAISPPVRDDSITIVNSTDDSDDDDDAFGSNPAADYGDYDYEDDGDDGGNGAHDDEAGNNGFVNNDSINYKQGASMEEAEGDVENCDSSTGPSSGLTINAASTPTYTHSIEDVPPLHGRIIKESMGLYWDINSPCDFQVVLMNQGTFHDDTMMYLISKTGSGKPVVP